MGMDVDDVCAVSRVPAVCLLSRVLRGLLRRRTLRDERRIAGHRARTDPADVPQLVPSALSVRLRHVPVRQMITRAIDKVAATAQFANDVQYYLSQQPRQLPSRYLYDELGSALFDAICRLPWYGVTRAELRLLESHGRQLLARVPDLTTIIELGPGNGEKLGALVNAGRADAAHLDLRLVDISASALDISSHVLSALPNVDVSTYEAEYEA